MVQLLLQHKLGTWNNLHNQRVQEFTNKLSMIQSIKKYICQIVFNKMFQSQSDWIKNISRICLRICKIISMSQRKMTFLSLSSFYWKKKMITLRTTANALREIKLKLIIRYKLFLFISYPNQSNKLWNDATPFIEISNVLCLILF